MIIRLYSGYLFVYLFRTEMKFHMTSNEDNEAAVKLLQHQEMPGNGSAHESHPLTETGNSKNSPKNTRIRFEESDELQINNQIIGSEGSEPTVTSRVRFSDDS